jgi:hypothetical protein
VIVASAFGVIVLGVLWTVWLIAEVAGPVQISGHHDFFAFYSAAELARAHQAELLYDPSTVTALERQIFPHAVGYAGYLPFLNPPSAAVVLSPLAALPEPAARVVWLFVGLATAVVCSVVLSAGYGARIRVLALLMILLSFPAYQTLVEGQWSFLLLLGAVGAVVAHRHGHEWLAGASLAVLWLKPPLLLVVLIWLLAMRHWRVAAGAITAVIGLTLITLPWAGIDANLAYIRYLGGVSVAHVAGGGAAGQTAWEGAFANMEGLLGGAAALVGQQHPILVDVLAGIAGAALVAFFCYAMRRRWTPRPLPLRFALAAVCLGLLLDPHLYAQDCVLLIVLTALALGRLQWLRVRIGMALGGRSRTELLAVLIVGTAALMDLSAVDTLWSQGLFPLPLHLLTMVLIVGVVGLAWPGRAPAGLRLTALG